MIRKEGVNMARIDVNLDGQRFVRWTVVETIPNYKNNKTYCLCICDCGTKKYVARHSLLSGGSQSCGCLAKELTAERCRKDYVGHVFGELTVLEMLYGYKNGKTYCHCLCSCGNECKVYINNLLNGSTKSCGCRSGELAWNTRGRTDLVGLIFGRLTVTEMLYGYGDNKRTCCKCICECGKEIIVEMQNVLYGRTTSCGCFEAESRYGRIHHKDITGQHFGHLTVIEKADYKSTNGGVVWKCVCDCGNVTYATYTELILGRKVTCGCSKYSKMELLIHDLLIEYNIPHISQAKFNECKNIFPLPFDFYLYEYNTLIEYDGAQHTRPVDFFGGEEQYQRRAHNDNIKNEYCKENGINLIRLSHTLTTDQIKEIIIHIWNP
jgi:very-short-patch-repair endonuclease